MERSKYQHAFICRTVRAGRRQCVLDGRMHRNTIGAQQRAQAFAEFNAAHAALPGVVQPSHVPAIYQPVELADDPLDVLVPERTEHRSRGLGREPQPARQLRGG